METPLARRIAARKAEQQKKQPVKPPWLARLTAKDLTRVG